jgi:hypothetical protein
MRAKRVSSIAEVSVEIPPRISIWGQIISETSYWSNILSSSTPCQRHACGNTASDFSNWLLLKQQQDRVTVTDFSARWIKTMTGASFAVFSSRSMF